MKRLAALIRTPAGTAAAAVLCCALWGSAFPVIKTGYAVIGIASDDWKTQILFAGIRFFTAGVITVILGSLIAGKFLIPKKTSLGKIPVLALFQTVLQYLFFYIGLAFTTGTKGSVLNSVSVFFSVILAAFVIKSERLTALKAVGCAVGFAGVIAVNLGAGLNAGFSIKGEGFIILSSLSYAI
jgi:drug/metabolite transporter (DMT)-like permease